jgi:hypothetical protein
LADTLTSGERLERFDQELEDVKRRFIEAVEQLQAEPAVDESFAERLGALAARLNNLRTALEPADYDKEQLVALFKALFRIRDVVDHSGGEPDLDACDELLIDIERIRHVVRDALDEHVTGVRQDRGLVIEDLKSWLPNTPLTKLAELIAVDPRTLRRWGVQTGPPQRRLRVVARLVAILRHNWTEEGVLAWFDRPRRDLEGRRPRTLLDDPNMDEALIMSARSGRSQYAS